MLLADGDLLSQWRTYASRDGYAIGFESKFIGLRPQAENLSQDFILRRVEYDEDVQRKLIQEAIDVTVSALTRATTGVPLESANNMIARCCQFLRAEVVDYFICFKNPAFKAEQEWRLFHLSVFSENPNLLFRNGPYGISPYVCLDPSPMSGVTANRLPIRSVRHGPTHHAENVRFGLKKLVQKFGYPFVEITGTELPVR